VAMAEEEEEEEVEEEGGKGEQRWVSSAPSWLAESPSPTPKTWSLESPTIWVPSPNGMVA
jgi:hypothetical protein